MIKKTIFVGFLTLSFLLIPVASKAAQYYDQYPGNGFQPSGTFFSYVKQTEGGIYLNDSSSAYFYCEVNFNVPEGSTYFIKSIGMRFKDNFFDGNIYVYLYRLNLYTGNIHVVAGWNSSASSSSSIQTASKGTNSGFKLVDSKKFAYWLCVIFDLDLPSNPSNNLVLYQVRIHYGT